MGTPEEEGAKLGVTALKSFQKKVGIDLSDAAALEIWDKMTTEERSELLALHELGKEIPPIEKLIKVIGVIGQRWIHTYGMVELGFPELEIRNLPEFLYPPSMILLNRIASYIVFGGGVVKVGERMQVGNTVVQFAEAPDWGKRKVWALVDVEGAMKCEGCEDGQKGHTH